MSNKLEAATGGQRLAEVLGYTVQVDKELSKKLAGYLLENESSFAVTAGTIWLSSASADLLAEKNWSLSMSNKVEAALGDMHKTKTFTDADGDRYCAADDGHGLLWLQGEGGGIQFYKSDAAKIIALIAEAAAE